MKLFYTCPIKAAYMSRKFEVYYEPEWPIEDLLYFASNLYAEQSPSDPVQQEKFYISIDSLPIFEPQVGDFLEIDGFFNDRKRHDWAADAPYDPTPVSVINCGDWLSMSTKGFSHDHNRDGRWHIPFKIISRNGKAFIAPESEG